jgi:isopenicillin N synthase-like dioxygenase
VPLPAVPLIDLSPFYEGTQFERAELAQTVDRACREIGFLAVTGHQIPPDVVGRAFSQSLAFFDRPDTQKRACLAADGGFLGYSALGDQALAYSLDDETPPDLFERFSMSGRVGDVWPADDQGLADALGAYYRAMETLAADLMRVFALALGLDDEHHFTGSIDEHISHLCVNNYPALDGVPLPGQLRAGAHTDYGSLTIVAPTAAPGQLQVRRDGEWTDVHPPPGAFVVNLGDLMAQWTNDRWVSTMHRVATPPLDAGEAGRRLALVFFHQPNADAVIECLPTCQSVDDPPRYEPVTSGEHLMMKVNKQYRVSEASTAA